MPWCIEKCPYCDFNSHALKAPLPEATYIQTLLNEVDKKAPSIQGRSIQTIFIGGGTPSLFSADMLCALMDGLKQRLDISPTAEITLEANPGTTEHDHFAGYLTAGINRLSLGVQSFQQQQLTQLGRIHGSEEAVCAVQDAQRAGFDNINIDLMFGLPHQTVAEGMRDLHTALSLHPTHLSWYQLTIEPHTAFFNAPPSLPEDSLIWDLQQAGITALEQHGFKQYEISAYATPNKRCEHNLNYWQFGDYLGLGAGAHSKITHLKTKHMTRSWNVKHPSAYMDDTQPFTRGTRTVPENEIVLEYMMNLLRLHQPIYFEHFETHTGLEKSVIRDTLARAHASGMLSLEEGHFSVTPHGHQFLNELLLLF